MNIEQSPSGRIIKTSSGYKAFVPNPLPPKLEWDDGLVYSLSRADFLLGQLAREGSKLPSPYLLIRPFVVREAVLSSKIEGTQVTFGEILAADSCFICLHFLKQLEMNIINSFIMLAEMVAGVNGSCIF